MARKRQKLQSVASPARLDDGDELVPVNARGLPTLPAELLLEIMAYFPRSKDPGLSDAFLPRLLYIREAEELASWRETVFSLSQTCKSLRLFFRPYLWRRIEVWEGMIMSSSPRKWNPRLAVEKEHNLEVVRQLEIVTVRDPSLAEFVQIVDVDVARYSDKSVLAEFARCLALFPNLHTVKLRILTLDKKANGLSKTIQKVFSKYSYPQIQTVILSKWAYPFLSVCPNLHSVRWMDPTRYSRHFWKYSSDAMTVLQSCGQLKSLALRAEDGEWLKDLVDVLPNLQHLVLNCDSLLLRFHLESSLKCLEKLRCLRKLEIVTISTIDEDERHTVLMHAKGLLATLRDRDGEAKEVVIRHGTRSGFKDESVTLPARRDL